MSVSLKRSWWTVLSMALGCIVGCEDPSCPIGASSVDGVCMMTSDGGMSGGTGGSSGAGGVGGTSGSGGQGAVAGGGSSGAGGVGGLQPVCPDEGESCGTNVGECAPGTITCDGMTPVCVGQVPPRAEVCDGLDNDCNGTPDDGISCDCTNGATRPCGSNDGECVAGVQTCEMGTWSACSGVGPTAEVCDGKDNDCNGVADDLSSPNCRPGSTRSCTTSCDSTGMQTCTSSCSFGACAPPVEVCNGVDDDCDGTADDGFSCRRGASVSCETTCGSIGSGTCTNSCTIPTGSACNPPLEVCNGRDDDCDNISDDGFECVQFTVGMCRGFPEPGTRQCSAFCTWGLCDGIDPR